MSNLTLAILNFVETTQWEVINGTHRVDMDSAKTTMPDEIHGVSMDPSGDGGAGNKNLPPASEAHQHASARP